MEKEMSTVEKCESFKPWKSVEIPHLRHTVQFADLSKLVLQGDEVRGAGYTIRFSEDVTCVFYQDIEKLVNDPIQAPIIAHELVHVLEHLLDKIGSRLEEESEHMAYIMTYLYEKLLEPATPQSSLREPGV